MLHIERTTEGQIVTIPINDDFRDQAKFDPNVILNLVVLINNDGSIKNIHVAAYTPKAESTSKLDGSTFANIFTTSINVPDGKFQFFTPSGRRQFELEYYSGRVVSTGKISSKQLNERIIHRNNIHEDPTTCIDWYLVTTYYYSDGTTEQTSQYVGTTCPDCDNNMFQSLCGGDEESFDEGDFDYDRTSMQSFDSNPHIPGNDSTLVRGTIEIHGSFGLFTSVIWLGSMGTHLDPAFRYTESFNIAKYQNAPAPIVNAGFSGVLTVSPGISFEVGTSRSYDYKAAFNL